MAADERTVREQKRACALVALGVAFPVAMSIARAELEREGRLVDGLRHRHQYEVAEAAIKEWEAEFAPPKRTVEQIAKDVLLTRVDDGPPFGVPYQVVPKRLLDELAKAIGAKGGAK